MAVLSSATTDDLIQLLELFPVNKIKDHWPKSKGHKEDLAKGVVASEKRPAIAAFVDKYFSCCKQHVYVFGHGGEVKKSPPAGHAGGERLLEQEGSGEGSALYVYRAEFTAVLTDPYEDATLKFLWPFRFEFTKTNVLIRLVVMEKNLSAHFGGREYVAAKKVTDEEVLIAAMLKGVGVPLIKTDLHKGLKKLWKDYLIDCVRVLYKDPCSTESTTMDEEVGIREKKPELYEALLKMPLLNAKFKIKSRELSDALGFYTVPADGYIGFTRYSESASDTDNVVREILKHNG